MFIGHWAPAFAAAALSPESPRLGTLFIAAQLVDWAFFLFAIVGIENMRVDPEITVMVPFDLFDMPYTHSLLGSFVFAVIFGMLIWALLRSPLAGLMAGGVVLCHWLLDLLVHAPDLTLVGGEHKLGLGLWNYPIIAMPLEIGITLLAFVFYLRSTKGPIGPPVILLSVMLVFQAINWFGPPPTEMSIALPLVSLTAFGIITAIAWWVGQNRWHKRARG
jgi:membrane-bound metal-dependent hydrolase YbcI (DUF457 family)